MNNTKGKVLTISAINKKGLEGLKKVLIKNVFK